MNIQLIELLQQQRTTKIEEANALMAKLGDIQAEINALSQQIKLEQSGHLRTEFLAGKARALALDEQRKNEASAQRYTEEQAKKQEQAQRAQEYQANVARQHQERADREAAAEKARREQLVAEGWVA